jgi:hypothetical protein
MSPVARGHDRQAGHDEAGPAMSDLERRYTRWTAVFYPADYRRKRGSELVDTYLSLAAPDRSRPSAADVADLAAGGLRQHLRIAEGLGPGFGLAGLLALMTATGFAAGWTILEALTPRSVCRPGLDWCPTEAAHDGASATTGLVPTINIACPSTFGCRSGNGNGSASPRLPNSTIDAPARTIVSRTSSTEG